jgi:hypothetical protein
MIPYAKTDKRAKRTLSFLKRKVRGLYKPETPELAAQVKMLLMKLNYSITPALPEGLKLVPATGVITGKPMEPVPEATYTVTANNSGGSVSCQITFAITLTAPSGLGYGKLEDVYYIGQPIGLSPSVEGIVEEWSVEPTLPDCLQLHPDMGSIGGVPNVEADGIWKVTAKNSEGEATTELKIVVKRNAPSGLTYPEAEGMYALQRPISGLTPVCKGVVDEYSVSPALPAGLTLDPKTGDITGIPSAPSDEVKYEITAKNSTGSTTTSLPFSVKLVPPEFLRYPRVDDVYNVGEQVSLDPEVVGGASKWEIEPKLPAGFAFDAETGKISGAPTETAEEASYVVTASNDAGGTSVVLTFKVTAPKPDGLTYPTATDEHMTGKPVNLEPEIQSGVCATFSVEPKLPGGLALDPKTGIISGSPEAPTDKATYTVTASNIAGKTSCDLTFLCSGGMSDEEMEAAKLEAFASSLEAITNLADMPPEPSRAERFSWMLWMVHRAHLNDPSLVDLSFSNMKMPLPHLEPRIAPKLMKALEHNDSICKLELANSNLQKPQGVQLAQSLLVNKTLKMINVETNSLDSESLIACANSLKTHTDSVLEQWRFTDQKSLEGGFGRPLEEAIADMLAQNQTITKIGFACQDPHWRNKIDTAMLRNNDLARRRRKGGGAVKIEEKVLGRLVLSHPPEKAVWDVFADDDPKMSMTRLFAATNKTLPTRDTLKRFATSQGVSLPFSGIAPLVKEFSAKLMTSAIGTKVKVEDDKLQELDGSITACKEQNDRWSFEIRTEAGTKYNFTAAATPSVEISDDFANWLRPKEEAKATEDRILLVGA